VSGRERLLGRVDITARVGILGVISATAVHGVAASRSLFADGTFYFWTELSTSGIFWYISRISAQLVMQLPVLGGLAMGITDVGALAHLQSLGMVGIPLALWMFALIVLRRDQLFWPMAVAFAVVYLTSGFMAVGEYNLSYAAVAASAAVLLRRAPLSTGWRISLLLLASTLPFSYETVAVLAPALAVILVLRTRTDARSGARQPRWFVIAALALYAVATAVSAWYVLVPRDPANASGAADIVGVLARDGQLRIAVAVGLIVVTSWALGSPRLRLGGSALAGVAGIALLLLPGEWATAGMHYEARIVAGLTLGVMLVPMTVAGLRPDRPMSSSPVWIGPAVFTAALAVPLAALTAGFPTWLGHYDDVVSRPGGATALEDSGLREDLVDRYGWEWTHPFLSRVLTGEDEVLIQPPGQQLDGWAPGPIPARFDTATPIFPAP
jgi:hypothetical protein